LKFASLGEELVVCKWALFYPARGRPPTTPPYIMSDHQREIEEFGNNDDFWLFGYGYDRLFEQYLHFGSTKALQELDMEATATLWYIHI
jgi:hypothetical protein